MFRDLSPLVILATIAAVTFALAIVRPVCHVIIGIASVIGTL
jgi:hypothetical protein